MVDESVS